MGQENQQRPSQTATVPGPAAVAGGDSTGEHRTRRPDWTVALPGLVTLGVMLWGLAAPSYWRDEADTLSAVNRTIPQLWRLLDRIDAVHGLYYFMVWPVYHLWGTREFEMRFPSAVAMALAACGVAVIGRRIRSRRAGLYAGLVFAVLPMVTIRGHDARPYAFETAAAVLATYLLVRAAQDPRARCWVAYGASVVLLGYLHMFGLVLIAAHALTLIPASRVPALGRDGSPAASRDANAATLGARPLVARWAVSATAAGVILVPLFYWGFLQRGAISWLPRPTWTDVRLLAIQLAGTTAMLGVIAVLAVLGVVRADWPDAFPRRRRPAGGPPALTRWAGRQERLLSLVSLTWLVLPPAILMLASQVASPMYEVMYVAYCLPAVALLAGAGLASVGQPLRITALVALVTLSVPTQLSLRTSTAGGSLRIASQILAEHERPGDAVYYQGTVPAFNITYPQGFGHLRDISFSETPAQAGRLVGPEPSVAVMQQRLRSVHRLWIIQLGTWHPLSITLTPDFRLEQTLQAGDVQMRLYVRVKPASS